MSGITGRHVVEDLEATGVDPVAVRLVREGLAAIADRIRALDPDPPDQSDGHVELADVLVLIDPNPPARERG